MISFQFRIGQVESWPDLGGSKGIISGRKHISSVSLFSFGVLSVHFRTNKSNVMSTSVSNTQKHLNKNQYYTKRKLFVFNYRMLKWIFRYNISAKLCTGMQESLYKLTKSNIIVHLIVLQSKSVMLKNSMNAHNPRFFLVFYYVKI